MADGVATDAIDSDDACRWCGEGGDLICCETCPAVWHIECLSPKLDSAPEGDWFCPTCSGTSARDLQWRGQCRERQLQLCQSTPTMHPVLFSAGASVIYTPSLFPFPPVTSNPVSCVCVWPGTADSMPPLPTRDAESPTSASNGKAVSGPWPLCFSHKRGSAAEKPICCILPSFVYAVGACRSPIPNTNELLLSFAL
jgi:hypothetical protein